ncbi:MAG: peptidase MA family metallohydrolase [Gemmatimonadaceae bacterium]
MARRCRSEQVQSMGEALRRERSARGGRRRARFICLTSCLALSLPAHAQDAPVRSQRGRFTVVAHPSDILLARTVLTAAIARDTFPGLPRPRADVAIVIARDARELRELAGPGVPEWGIAVASPSLRRIVLQGRAAGSEAGDPLTTLRHELAHLALHEYLGDLPPRWFDEGYASYAAGEWRRDDALAAQFALALRGVPTLEGIDSAFTGGTARADYAYALAHRAVADLAALDRQRGLALFFREWRGRGSLDAAVRHAYGITLGTFEKMWRSRTRRRYGALAAVTDLTLAAALLLLVVAPFYVARRRRDRRRLAELRDADAARERTEARSAIDALLQESDEPSSGSTSDGRPA